MNINVTIDGRKLNCSSELTIMDAAQLLNISIPTICYHERLTPPGLCRQCVVEVDGARVLLPACITVVRDGMVVRTNSERVIRARRTILEMLAGSVDLSDAPELQQQIQEYKAMPDRFIDPHSGKKTVLYDNPFYIRDYAKCILCERCVQVCSEEVQLSYALTTAGRGSENRIATFYDKPLPETSCVFCGNCIDVCPTGALKAKKEVEIDI